MQYTDYIARHKPSEEGETMPACPQCQHPVPEGAMFCNACGAAIGQPEAAAEMPPAAESMPDEPVPAEPLAATAEQPVVEPFAEPAPAEPAPVSDQPMAVTAEQPFAEPTPLPNQPLDATGTMPAYNPAAVPDQFMSAPPMAPMSAGPVPPPDQPLSATGTVSAYNPDAAPSQPMNAAAAPAGAPVPPSNAQAGAVPPSPAPQKKPGRKNMPIIIAVAAIAALVIGIAGFNAYSQSQRAAHYDEAVTLMQNGDYESAMALFEDLGDYQDAPDRVNACEQAIAYQDATDLLDAGDYQAARDAFEALGDYNDAQDMVATCDKWLAYQDAQGLLDGGDYQAARDAFAELGSFEDAEDKVSVCDGWLLFAETSALTDEGKYEEAAEKATGFFNVDEIMSSSEYQDWSNRNDYGLAENMLSNGQNYGAYNLFTSLGSYEDASEKAQSCILEFPGDYELYHNEGYVSSSNDVVFDGTSSTIPVFLKLYSGETLVSSVFLNPGGKVTIQVPAGSYTIKEGTGSDWFGPEDAFGSSGVYKTMVFEDGSTTQDLGDNLIWTLTLQYSGNDGNISTEYSDYDSF